MSDKGQRRKEIEKQYSSQIENICKLIQIDNL